MKIEREDFQSFSWMPADLVEYQYQDIYFWEK
jgi:hypothetical protein